MSKDTEEWRPVVGYEGFYEVSSLGRVRSCDRYVVHPAGVALKKQRVLAQGFCAAGYARVSLHKYGRSTTHLVSRMVAMAFAPNDLGLPQAAHRNGNKKDNSVANLVWATQSDNEAHKVAHGTHRRGGRHPLARLSADDVARIRSSQLPKKELAAAAGVSVAHINQIKAGRRWAHV